MILPKLFLRDIIEQLLNHLYKERSIKEYSEWRKKIILRDIAVVETLFSTGLRISELCHLQNKYVDLKNGVLCIQGKGGKERYLQIGNNDVLSILNAYKKYFEDEIKKQGYFFVNRYGNALSEQSARSMIHKYAGEIQADINIHRICSLAFLCDLSDGGGREYQIHTKNAGTCFDYHNADIYICND